MLAENQIKRRAITKSDITLVPFSFLTLFFASAHQHLLLPSCLVLFSCGLMLTLSTNLVVWMTAVTEESVHQTTAPKDPEYPEYPEYPSNATKIHGRGLYIKGGN